VREIKFRAWDKKAGFMHEVYKIDFEEKCLMTETFGMLFDEAELMQYTGLKDKNGKEIYEGDIIKNYSKSFGAEFVTKEVKFTEFLLNYGYEHYEMGEISEDTYEVIGNIYENPELIKD